MKKLFLASSSLALSSALFVASTALANTSSVEGLDAAAAANYVCYATDANGTTYSASGYGSQDRIQQNALDVCKEDSAVHGCRRAGCELE
jgi:hypothetical protein